MRTRRNSIGTQSSYVCYNKELGLYTWNESDYSLDNHDKYVYCGTEETRKRRYSINTQPTYARYNKQIGLDSWKQCDYNCHKYDKEIFCLEDRTDYNYIKKEFEVIGEILFSYGYIWKWQRPITISCEKGNLMLLKKLCRYGANNNCLRPGENPLTLAVKERHIDIVRYLLRLGADVNYNDNFVETPLITSCMMLYGEENTIPIILLLLKHGANMEKPFFYDSDTPLCCVIDYTNLEVAETLINKGANCRIRNNVYGNLVDRFILWYLRDKKFKDKNKYTRDEIISFFGKLKENGLEISDSEINYKVSVIINTEKLSCCQICFELKEMKTILPCCHACFCTECCEIFERSKKCAMCRSHIMYML